MRVAINLESLVKGFGLELSEALSRYVLGGIMSRSEARRAIGLPGRADTDPMLQPVNVDPPAERVFDCHDHPGVVADGGCRPAVETAADSSPGSDKQAATRGVFRNPNSSKFN